MISVVIPVYNVEKYLDKCVSSVIQLESDVEVILVDDGSTDKSGSICDAWANKDRRIKVIHQKNGGLSEARNTGIRHSTGDFIMFLDSDDFLDAHETDIMLNKLAPETEVMLGLYNNYYTQEEKFEKEFCDAFLSVEGKIQVEEFLRIVPCDGKGCFMTAWRFIVRRDVLIENELFFYPGIYHEDEEWNIRLFSVINNIQVSHNYFYQYRQAREGAITGKVSYKNIKDRFIILERAVQLLKDNNLNSERKSFIKNRMAQLYLSNMIDSRVLNKDEKEEVFIQLSRFSQICSKNLCGKMGTLVKISENILGIPMTCQLLNIVRVLIKREG